MDITDFGRELFPLDSDWRVIHCLRCHSILVLHQPDPDLADRLLPTCDECRSWFLLASKSVELTPLPDVSDDVTRHRSAN
jgi:hypothetical protein